MNREFAFDEVYNDDIHKDTIPQLSLSEETNASDQLTRRASIATHTGTLISNNIVIENEVNNQIHS